MTPDPPSEPCWSVFLSFLTCGILPATTARRTNHVPLRQAYLVHVATALLGVFVIVLIATWGDASAPATLDMGGAGFLSTTDFFLEQLARKPKEVVLTILGIALLVELGFLGVAYLVMPWGAYDEPLGASFRHALRRVWLQTPHVVLIIATVGAIGIPLSRWDRAWRASYTIPMPSADNLPPVVAMPKNAAPDSQAWQDYQKALQDFNEAWQTHWAAVNRWSVEMRRSQPWYLRFSEATTVDAGFLSGLWLLWALLRSVGAPRVVPAVERPPRCDACGYNLTTIPMESRCPECGEPVAASLGPDARPGTAWQHRELDRLTAWRRSWGEAIRDPVRFGRTLRLTSPGVDHRRFLAIHLSLVFLIGAISPAVTFWAVEGRSPIPDEIEFILIGGPIFGTACTAGVMAVSLLSAAAAAILYHFRDRRNLLAGAVQVVSYLVVYLVAWQVFGAVTGICAVSMGQAEWFRGFARASRMGPELLAFFFWFIPNLACGIVYWTLVRRAVSGTRFANR